MQTDLHEQLLQLSNEKLHAIKQSATESLVKLLTKERQLIQKIEQLEDEREEVVELLFQTKNIKSDEKTLTELLPHIDKDSDKRLLEQKMAKLVKIIVSLRDSEQLNNRLLQQSMQFVQLTLDMLQPETKKINYSNQQQIPKHNQGRSVFDSKV